MSLPLPDNKEYVLEVHPAMVGAGGDDGNAILGVVLIIVAVVLMWYGEWNFSSQLVNFAFGLLIVGIQLVLMPDAMLGTKPKAGVKTPQYNFNGTVNTVQIGYPVPIGYGSLTVGSAVVGGEIVNEWM